MRRACYLCNMCDLFPENYHFVLGVDGAHIQSSTNYPDNLKCACVYVCSMLTLCNAVHISLIIWGEMWSYIVITICDFKTQSILCWRSVHHCNTQHGNRRWLFRFTVPPKIILVDVSIYLEDDLCSLTCFLKSRCVFADKENVIHIHEHRWTANKV